MKFIMSMVMTALLCVVVTPKINAQTAENLEKITVKVKGITCSTDLKMIQKSVETLKGVSTCKVGKQGTTTHFVITYDSSLLKEEELHTTIEGTGSCENPEERPYKVKK